MSEETRAAVATGAPAVADRSAFPHVPGTIRGEVPDGTRAAKPGESDGSAGSPNCPLPAEPPRKKAARKKAARKKPAPKTRRRK